MTEDELSACIHLAEALSSSLLQQGNVANSKLVVSDLRRLVAEIRRLRALVRRVQPFTAGLYGAARNPDDEKELLQLEDDLKAEVER
jgi:hypothetical protein